MSTSTSFREQLARDARLSLERDLARKTPRMMSRSELEAALTFGDRADVRAELAARPAR